MFRRMNAQLAFINQLKAAKWSAINTNPQLPYPSTTGRQVQPLVVQTMHAILVRPQPSTQLPIQSGIIIQPLTNPQVSTASQQPSTSQSIQSPGWSTLWPAVIPKQPRQQNVTQNPPAYIAPITNSIIDNYQMQQIMQIDNMPVDAAQQAVFYKEKIIQ